MFKPRNTLVKTDFKLNYDMSNVATLWCVYTHTVNYAEGAKIMWVGTCLLKECLNGHDARKNKAWRQHIAPLTDVTVDIVALTVNQPEAYTEMARISRTERPFCNVQGERDRSYGQVRCVEDGNTFVNASQAASFYNISTSALSNHLNGRKGYTSIHTLHFERI